MLQVGQHAVESEDEEVALNVFDLFIDILEGSAQLLGPHLAALVQWCMAVASNTEVALDTRGQAAQVSLGQSCSRAAALERTRCQSCPGCLGVCPGNLAAAGRSAPCWCSQTVCPAATRQRTPLSQLRVLCHFMLRIDLFDSICSNRA